MVSFERLSLVIEYNQIGSLSSLGRSRGEHVNIIRTRSNSIIRRRSDLDGITKATRGSVPKVDLLKSTLEVNNSRNSNSLLLKSHSNYLNSSSNANSTGKVGLIKRIIKCYYFAVDILDSYRLEINAKSSRIRIGNVNSK